MGMLFFLFFRRGRSFRSYLFQFFGDKQKFINFFRYFVYFVFVFLGMFIYGIFESCFCDCFSWFWSVFVVLVGFFQSFFFGFYGDVQVYCFFVVRCFRERRFGWCRGFGAIVGTGGVDCRGVGVALVLVIFQFYLSCVCACDMYSQLYVRILEVVFFFAFLMVVFRVQLSCFFQGRFVYQLSFQFCVYW